MLCSARRAAAPGSAAIRSWSAICRVSSSMSSWMRGRSASVGAAQVALRIGQAVTQRLQRARGRAQPIQVAAQLRQAGLEVAAEVNVLPRLPRRNGSSAFAVEPDRDDRLLVLERVRPLLFAGRVIFDAVGGHARRSGSRNRGSPRQAARPNRSPGSRWRLSSQTGSRAARRSTHRASFRAKSRAINRGVADEVVDGHGWTFCVSAKTRD